MHRQRGMSFIGILILVILGLSIVLLVVKLFPAYQEFYGVKQVMTSIAKDPSFSNMSPADIRNSFDRKASIQYVTVVNGNDLDLAKINGENVASIEYEQRIPLAFNISACLEFSASTAESKGKSPRAE